VSADEKKRTIPSEGYMRLPEVLYVFPISLIGPIGNEIPMSTFTACLAK
jgi:hypothetical protein